MRVALSIIDRENIVTVSFEWRPWQHFSPGRSARQLDIRSLDRARFERTRFRKVSAKVAGVDDHLRQNPGYPKLQNAPVMTRGAAPARLPAVHPFAAVGV